MSHLSLTLFGPFALRDGRGAPIAVPTRKSRALLAYLAMPPGQPHAREKLAGLFWGERGERQARHSLSQALFAIKGALAGHPGVGLEADGDTVRLRGEGLEVDAARFQELAALEAAEAMAGAAQLYRGDLLEGLNLGEEQFDDWLRHERERLRQLAADVLSRLLRAHEARDEIEPAIASAARLLSLDAMREDALRALMRLQARVGRPAAALEHYRRAANRLRQELGIEPEPETRRLYEQILARRQAGAATSVVRNCRHEALPLPAKPSVAVLPFGDLGGEAASDYLADGLTEDLITALSKVTELFVTAPSSAFAYKGRAADIEQIRRGLGVRYLLRGSMRSTSGRMRISAQLVDTTTGEHVWAERYDREVNELFDLQDEITQEIVTALQVRLTEGEQVRLRHRQTRDLVAWECFVRGQALLRHFNKEDNVAARTFFEEALRRDAEFAAAWGHLAWTHMADARLGWGTSAAVSLEQGAALAKKSIALDDMQPDAYAVLGAVRLCQRRYRAAETAGRRAVELGPSVADSYAFLAMTLNYVSRAEEALALLQKAMRFSPFYPSWYLGIQGVSFRVLGRYDEAIEADLLRLARDPDNTISDFRLAAVYAGTGREKEARAHIEKLLAKNPQASIRQVRACEPYQDEAELQRYLDLLRNAGLPD